MRVPESLVGAVSSRGHRDADSTAKMTCAGGAASTFPRLEIGSIFATVCD